MASASAITAASTATGSASSTAPAASTPTRPSTAPTSTRSPARPAITIYNLRPAYINARDRYISNVEALKSNYDGVQFDFQKRMSNRWQMLAGLSLQQHRGFDHSGTYTGTDFSNPNSWINRDDSSIFIDLPWVFTLSGSYQLPWDIMFSGSYTSRAGDPLNRTVTFTGLTASQASETVRWCRAARIGPRT